MNRKANEKDKIIKTLQLDRRTIKNLIQNINKNYNSASMILK